MPAFSFRHVKELNGIFWAKSCELVSLLAPGANQNNNYDQLNIATPMSSWLRRVTLDIIGIAGLGYDYRAMYDPESEANQTYRTLFDTVDKQNIMAFIETMENLVPVHLLGKLPIKYNIEQLAAADSIRKISRDILRGRTTNAAGFATPRIHKDIISVAQDSGSFTAWDGSREQ